MPVQRDDAAVLGQDRPAPLRGLRQTPRQPGRVEHDVPVRPRAHPRQPRRRVDRRLDRLPVEQLQIEAVAGGQLHVLPEVVDLVRRDGDVERARRLELAVDALGPHERNQRREVLDALALEDVDLVRVVAQRIGKPVGQRGGAEPAVPPARAPADPVRLEHDHAQRWLRVEQPDRRPQAGEAGADDRDIRGHAAPHGRADRARISGRIPVAPARGPRIRSIGRASSCINHVPNVRGLPTRWRSDVRYSCADGGCVARFALTGQTTLWQDRAIRSTVRNGCPGMCIIRRSARTPARGRRRRSPPAAGRNME